MPVRNPTQWFTPNHYGSVVINGNNFIVDNSGNFIVTNSHDFIVTTPLVMTSLNPTWWGGATGVDDVLDESGGNVLDEMSHDVESEQTLGVATTINPTQWFPANRQGPVVQVGNAFVATNSKVFIVDNSGNFIITTPIVSAQPNATAWVPTQAS